MSSALITWNFFLKLSHPVSKLFTRIINIRTETPSTLIAKSSYFPLHHTNLENSTTRQYIKRLAPRAPREVLGDSRLERLGASANPARGFARQAGPAARTAGRKAGRPPGGAALTPIHRGNTRTAGAAAASRDDTAVCVSRLNILENPGMDFQAGLRCWPRCTPLPTDASLLSTPAARFNI